MCAGGVGESCGAITDNLCDDSLICAKPLLEFQPRPAIYEIKLDEYWVSTGTCQGKLYSLLYTVMLMIVVIIIWMTLAFKYRCK